MYTDIKKEKENLKFKLFTLLGIIGLLLFVGTIVYHLSEGWSVLDSLYFAAISLATRGYSDMHPTTWFSVLFSIFYLFVGVGIMIYAISTLIAYYTSFYEKKFEKAIKNFNKPKAPDKWVVLKTKK